MSDQEKVFKSATGVVKSTIERAISNGMSFCVQIAPLQNNEGEFFTAEAVNEWIESVKVTLEYKPVHPKALEGMKKNFLRNNPGKDISEYVPKKQPAEILHILICPADDRIFVTCHVPGHMPIPSIRMLSKQEMFDELIVNVLPPAESSVFKHKEAVLFDILGDLKKNSFYAVEEEEDEVIIDYLNNPDLVL